MDIKTIQSFEDYDHKYWDKFDTPTFMRKEFEREQELADLSKEQEFNDIQENKI